MDSGEFPYCIFGRWFCTGNVLSRCLDRVIVPESVVVIARNTLAIKDQRVACLVGEGIIIDGDERAGTQFCSTGQKDAAFFGDDKLASARWSRIAFMSA